MESWQPESNPNKDFVEAIEGGKIVRVSERYAKIEGLPILRKPRLEQKNRAQNEPPEKISFDDLRKPLRPNQVTSELIDNFHWHILKKRRQLGLTRKKLAEKINESENTLKLIENGVIPNKDFIIINKIQSSLLINLRKDKKDFTQSPRSLLKEEEQEPKTEISGEEIELIEDEEEYN